jgi:threonylcarbamoyladenosine tRNA methylthiotransferase MtaB
MRITIATLGCKVNQSESAAIEGILREYGHEIVNYTDNPDVCIVNTCTVTAKSDYQSRQLIRRAVKTGARVIATGCYAQLRPDELLKIEGLDLILGNSQKNKLHEYLYRLPPKNCKLKNDPCRPSVLIDSPETPLMLGPYFSNRARAFLKIQDGCNFSCSYCTVPLARGRSRSLGPQDVLKAVDRFSSEGFKEIVLTGIHIGCYGLELQPKSSLLEIVKKIVKAYPLIRLRLSSIEPREFKREFLSLIKEGSVCPHLHIPLQSGSDRILKAMNRGYTTSFFKELINDIVLTCPEISIGTDVIVGFPGETDEDFENTVKLLKQLPLSYIHVFPYSKRPNTKASLLKNQVSEVIKRKRVKVMLDLAKMKKNAYITRYLGHNLDVIVEGKAVTNGFYSVISDNYLRLLVRADNLFPGQRLLVRAVTHTDIGLIAQPL